MGITTNVIMLIGALVLLFVGAMVGMVLRKKFVEANIAGAKKNAEEIVGGARREAETIEKEASLKAKDQVYQSKMESEKELSERRKELQSIEKRLLSKEESLDKKSDAFHRSETELSKKSDDLSVRERSLSGKESELDGVIAEQRTKLETVAGMSVEEAKQTLISSMEGEARLEAGKLLKTLEEETRNEAEKKAKDIIGLAIQRYAGDYVAEKTVSVVNLPSDEMKGRIIGREGRNIRAIEAATGVDLIIDDTPGAVILSGHNPVRREIARQTLQKLVSDGRIHPSRVEEVVSKIEVEVEKSIVEAGERATFDTGLHGIHPEIQKLIGRLKFRSSYAQNVYAHSMEVAFICGIMAAELNLPVKIAKRAGLLHDIGKAVDHEIEGGHATIGADLAKKYGEKPVIVAAIGQHHDPEPESVFGVLVQAADTLSAARPGARREMYETYIKRLDDLEKISNDFKGVDKAYALQAGREVRVVVESASVDDSEALVLSREIAQKIESELSYPGQIKITVVRETRAVEYAK